MFTDLNRLTSRPFIALVPVVVAMLCGCGGGGGSAGNTGSVAPYPVTPVSCSVTDQRSWLNSYMADRYYWYAQMRTPDTSAADMNGYFKSLLATAPTLDRYSYTEATAQYQQFFGEGVFVGYGYSLAWSDVSQTVLKVRQVEPLGPVYFAGLRRGDTIVSIDGHTPAEIVAGTPGKVTTTGIARTFVIRDSAGNTRTFTASSNQFSYTSVPSSAVLPADIGGVSAKVGYMVYQQFINPSKTELATAFNSFAANGVRELVVDLRYNGGGSVALARDFASMIGGTRLAGTTFAQLRYNTRHPEDNATYPFVAAPDIAAQPLSGLSRVVIIASPGTASASELVINGLAPHTQVVLIGSTTYGKPYGFLPRDACGLTYSAVNFMSFNSQNQTFSGDGIAPTCEVADDLDHQLGDPAEARLSAALYYLKNGSCPTATARVATLRSGGSTQRAVAVDNAFGEVPAPRMLAD